MERESMQFDVVVVGAGPAGLAAAIRLMQLAEAEGRETAVCVVEKGSEVAAARLARPWRTAQHRGDGRYLLLLHRSGKRYQTARFRDSAAHS